MRAKFEVLVTWATPPNASILEQRKRNALGCLLLVVAHHLSVSLMAMDLTVQVSVWPLCVSACALALSHLFAMGRRDKWLPTP